MPAEVILPKNYMRGDVKLHAVFPAGASVGKSSWRLLPGPKGDPRLHHWSARTDFEHNDFLYEWGAIFGNLLLRKGLNYGVGGMYLEFENVGTPGDPVAAPTFTRDADQGVDYYNSLADSADRDYLRVPLVAGNLTSSDATKYPLGNLVSFFAQTSGVEGVHGKPFSDANNSVVYGGALVAFVDDADHTRDIVLSRFYVSTASQQPKLSTSQVGFEWRLLLG